MMLDIVPSGAGETALDRYAWFGAAPRPTRSQFLGAMVEQGWWSSIPGQLVELHDRPQRYMGERYADEEEWRASEHWRPGLRFEPGMTREIAGFDAAIYDENRVREDRLGRRRAGVVDTALGFGAAMLGSVPDPTNFVPFVGPSWRAAQIVRFGSVGGRAVAGAADAAIGNALASPLILANQARFGDDVGIADYVLDMSVGAAIGTVFGAGSGVLARWHGRDLSLIVSAREQATAKAMLDESATAIAEGRGVRVDPSTVAEIDKLRNALTGTERALEEAEARAAAATRHAEASGRLAGVEPGGEVEVRAGAGSDVVARVRYEVVEADALITSHGGPEMAPDPRFAAELQVCDRDRAASVQQVRERATRLDPSQLTGSPLGSTGAPIVGGDGLVESGNGRVLSIRLAYDEAMPGATAYRQVLRDLGFDLEGMRAPVLIRRRLTDMDRPTRVQWADDANRDVIERRSATEEARADARLLTPEVTARLVAGDLTSEANADFVRAFVEALPAAEQAAMATPGKRLSADGLARIDRAVQARAYGDRRLVSTLLESTDEPLQRLGAVLRRAAPAVVAWRSAVHEGRILAQLDGTQDLITAALLVQDARTKGSPLVDLLNLPADLTGDGPSAAARIWLALMLQVRSDGRARLIAGDDLVARITRAAGIAEAAPTGPDMFGQAPPTLRQVLATVAAEERVDLPYLPDGIRDFSDPPARPMGPTVAAEAPDAPQRARVSGATALPAADNAAGIDEATVAIRQGQTGWTLDDLYARAEANDVELGRAVAEIANLLAVEGKKGPIKARETAAAKIERKRLGGADELTDIVRAGFTATTPEIGDSIVAELAKRFAVLDEGWAPTQLGYFDRKVLIRFGDGMVGEVQIWPPGMLEARGTGGGHKLYEQWRTTDVTTDEGKTRKQELTEQSRVLYEAAMEAAGGDWLSLSRKLGSGGSGPNLSTAASRVSTRPVLATSAASTSTHGPPLLSTANATPSSIQTTAGRPSQLVQPGSDIDEPPTNSGSVAQIDPELAILAGALDELAAAGRLDADDLVTIREGNQAGDKAAAMADALEAGLSCLIRSVT